MEMNESPTIEFEYDDYFKLVVMFTNCKTNMQKHMMQKIIEWVTEENKRKNFWIFSRKSIALPTDPEKLNQWFIKELPNMSDSFETKIDWFLNRRSVKKFINIIDDFLYISYYTLLTPTMRFTMKLDDYRDMIAFSNNDFS